MPKKSELSVQSFVNCKGNCVNISSICLAEQKSISQDINIKALGRLNNGYIFEKTKTKSYTADKNK